MLNLKDEPLYIVDYDDEDIWICKSKEEILTSVNNFHEDNTHVQVEKLLDFINVRVCYETGYNISSLITYTLRELLEDDFFSTTDIQTFIDKQMVHEKAKSFFRITSNWFESVSKQQDNMEKEYEMLKKKNATMRAKNEEKSKI